MSLRIRNVGRRWMACCDEHMYIHSPSLTFAVDRETFSIYSLYTYNCLREPPEDLRRSDEITADWIWYSGQGPTGKGLRELTSSTPGATHNPPCPFSAHSREAWGSSSLQSTQWLNSEKRWKCSRSHGLCLCTLSNLVFASSCCSFSCLVLFLLCSWIQRRKWHPWERTGTSSAWSVSAVTRSWQQGATLR